MRASQFLDRRELDLFAPIFGLVRLSRHAADLMLGVQERLQDHRREIRRSHKDDLHLFFLFFVYFFFGRTDVRCFVCI